MNWTPFVLPIVISFGIAVFIININNISNIRELNTCPLCYGEDLCKDINDKISLSYETISYLFYNLLSVKNVYFAKYGNDNVVLKKLAHNDELTRLDLIHCMTDTVLTSYNQSYKLCDDHTVKLLLEQFEHVNFTNLCTILNVNIEPIVLQLFKDDFPVPKFYGSCGRVIVEGNSGTDLNSMESLDWFDRAYLSYQLLEAAQRFTYDHPSFRLYLMDISPDNIAVNKDLVVNFIDLEHVILKAKGERVGGLHRSEDFPGEPYGFSEGEICGSEVSDHNVYSVCKLLLSKSSPWPMMNGGLLYDPPPEVLERHRGLFELVELCVVPYGSSNRFEVSDSILGELKGVLEGRRYIL